MNITIDTLEMWMYYKYHFNTIKFLLIHPNFLSIHCKTFWNCTKNTVQSSYFPSLKLFSSSFSHVHPFSRCTRQITTQKKKVLTILIHAVNYEKIMHHLWLFESNPNPISFSSFLDSIKLLKISLSTHSWSNFNRIH